MRPRVAIISSEFPPRRGGVADHTVILATQLSQSHEVTVVTSAGATKNDRFKVVTDVVDWADGVALVLSLGQCAPTSTFVWQYVPHAYGRGGVNFALPRVMRALQGRGGRQVVVAHEIHARLSWWPHRLWYALAHRRQWRAIVSCVDAIGISTEAWLERCCRDLPAARRKLRLLNSPATIPTVDVEPNHRERWRRQQGLPPAAKILACFGSIADTAQFELVRSAWLSASADLAEPVALVVIGSRPTAASPADLEPLYRPLGYQPGSAVSAALQAADVLALPFIDGVSERRTSFMAGLNHGSAVVTTLGVSTGPTLRRADSFRAVEVGDRPGFSRIVTELLRQEDDRKRLGRAAVRVYDDRYNWRQVVSRLRQMMDSSAG